jgi:ABC-2 type transport system ATP-binding protein
VTVAGLTAVTKRFRAVTALDDVSFAVAQAEVLALLGPNGAGKSTAIAVLLGLRAPDAGSARLFGLDPRRTVARRGVGVVPQEAAFPQTLRVVELIELVRRHFPDPLPLADLGRRLGLEPLLGRQLGGLSGGERRLVAVALAFAGAPRLLVLDEPTSALDGDARARVWDAVREHAAGGGSVLLTTHHLAEAEALARRVVVLERGVVTADSDVAELRRSAGLTRVSYRDRSGSVSVDVDDAGALVASLVRRGVCLGDLQVRPLTLEEALAAHRSRR